MRLVRVGISLGLIAGVLVYGGFALSRLSQPPTVERAMIDFNKASDAVMQQPDELSPAQAVAELARPDPSRFIPILRDNPHPGMIEPYQNAAPYGQPPYRQPNTDGEVWELCAYRVATSHPADAIEHYAAQARARGLDLLASGPTTRRTPDGLVATWTDGSRTLQVTAWPTLGQTANPPVAAPLRPVGSLDWVVKYSYPAPRDDAR